MTEILEKLVDKVEKTLGKKVKAHKVPQNNGIVLTALSVVPDGEEAVPNICIDELLDLLKKGYIPYEAAVERILWEMKERKASSVKLFDIKSILNEDVSKKIIPCVINEQKNREMLRSWVNTPLDGTDLVTIYKLVIYQDENMIKTTTLTNKMLQMANMTIEDVKHAALDNTKNIYKIVPIPIMLPDFPPFFMFALTNTSCQFGASVLLHKKYLGELAEMLEDDLLILPSSIHEVIALPISICADNDDFETFKEIVKEANAIDVSPTEILSNECYLYNKETEDLSIL